MTDEMRQWLRAVMAEQRKRPHEERWQEMIDDGVIDKDGNVLLRAISPWTDLYPEFDPRLAPVDRGQTEPEA